MPFRPTPFFTGRDEKLRDLQIALKTGHRVIINGMPGVGKTQLALEYVRQHKENYQKIFWLQADQVETFIAGFSELARLLNLPEKGEHDQRIIVEAMNRWFAGHDCWLLIVDNADNLAQVEPFLPLSDTGHTLITSRASSVGGVAGKIELHPFNQNDAVLCLLRRSKHIAPEATIDQVTLKERKLAEQISGFLGHLPLALDQAGAYIEQTHSTLEEYRQLYQDFGRILRAKRGELPTGHKNSVTLTFRLAFTQVDQANPEAADLMRLCAFLHPDSIPEALLIKGVAERKSSVDVDVEEIEFAMHWPTIRQEACRWSLLHRDGTDISLHRLVQAVLLDEMDKQTRQQWIEYVVGLVSRNFPEPLYVEQWPQCERLISHSLVCAEHIQRWNIVSSDAGALLSNTGSYLYYRGRYEEAEPLYQSALEIREKVLGTRHPDVATSLNSLAKIYQALSRYHEAQLLFKRALKIREEMLDVEHPDVATSLNNLAELYRILGRYEEAEPLYQKALEIREKVLDTDHPDIAASLSALPILYYLQGRFEEAEPLLERALLIREKNLGAQHPSVAMSLGNLALLYHAQARYEAAEPLLQRALSIREKVLGDSHPEMAQGLNNLARLYRAQGRYEEAELFYRRALEIREKVLDPNHPDVADSLNNLAELQITQGHYAETELLLKRALMIKETALGEQHHRVGGKLN